MITEVMKEAIEKLYSPTGIAQSLVVESMEYFNVDRNPDAMKHLAFIINMAFEKGRETGQAAGFREGVELTNRELAPGLRQGWGS